MASAAIARAAAVGPTAAAPQAHANSSMLSAKAIALVMSRVLARRAPACADKTRDGGDGDGGGNDWDNAAGERAPGARGNEVTTQEVQLAAGAQQHQCLAQLQQEFCQLSTKDASFDDEDLDDQALLEAARELAEQSSSTELCCSGLEALSVEADTCATDKAAAAAARIQAAWRALQCRNAAFLQNLHPSIRACMARTGDTCAAARRVMAASARKKATAARDAKVAIKAKHKRLLLESSVRCRTERRAAACIQAAARATLARKTRAAARLQEVPRVRLAPLHAAATRVQAAARGRLTRRWLALAADAEALNLAAITIQRAALPFITRRLTAAIAQLRVRLAAASSLGQTDILSQLAQRASGPTRVTEHTGKAAAGQMRGGKAAPSAASAKNRREHENDLMEYLASLNLRAGLAPATMALGAVLFPLVLPAAEFNGDKCEALKLTIVECEPCAERVARGGDQPRRRRRVRSAHATGAERVARGGARAGMLAQAAHTLGGSTRWEASACCATLTS